jgi:hypothetical protein
LDKAGVHPAADAKDMVVVVDGMVVLAVETAAAAEVVAATFYPLQPVSFKLPVSVPEMAKLLFPRLFLVLILGPEH